MSRAARLLAIAAAWAIPVVWVGVALRPDRPTGPRSRRRRWCRTRPGWGDGVTIVRTYGETPLEPGDVVQAIEGRPWGYWLTDGGALDVDEGETLTYGILRPGDVGVELQVEVTLTDVAVRSALAVALLPVGLAGAGLLRRVLLAVGTGRAPRRTGRCSAGASLSACGITTTAAGAGSGRRGRWSRASRGRTTVVGAACAVRARASCACLAWWSRG